jgi:MurNAc alpha-1-phosphate uridylyltransferase
MILAAGRGERMRPLTDHCPKPLLEVGGRPLIVHHLEALGRAGIDSVVINVCWLAEQIMSLLGDGASWNLEIVYSHEKEALETAGGIIQALDLLQDEFMVINGDVYSDYDLSRLRSVDHLAHLVMVPNPEHHVQGDFSIQQGLLSNDSESRRTFSGIACYQKSFFKDYEKGRRALAPMLREGAANHELSAELYEGLWSDVGTVDRLYSLQQSCGKD